jgi:hypothetical protein
MNTTGIVPYKTSEGHDELARRTRRLGQRHRTMLLLVDGRRSVDQVLALGLAAGVAEQHYRELLEAGLIALPEGALTAATQPVPLDEPSFAVQVQADVEASTHVELPVEHIAAVAAPAPPVPAPPMPISMPSLQLPVLHESPPVVTARPERLEPPDARDEPDAWPATRPPHDPMRLDDPLMPPPIIDGPLEEAREILMRAVRAEAPVAGQLTLLKLKHASDRADLQALLGEVEQRIARPRKMVLAAQTLHHVKQLLCMPPSTAFTLY